MEHTISLNTGAEVPLLGLGTWKSDPKEVYHATKLALQLGYRHFDCAWIYANEKEVGQALKEFLEEDPSVKREDIFLTSKLWNTFHHPDDVLHSLQASLDLLQTPYLDLYLIHWPVSFQRGGDAFPKDSNGKVLDGEIDFEDTWKAMEALPKEKARAIGVSNFNQEQLEKLLRVAKVIPAMNQVELQPYFPQEELVAFCKANGIQVTAFSPLGSPARPPHLKGPEDPVLLEDETVISLAKKYSKTTAQILIRFHLEQKTVVIPKSTRAERLKENLESLDFRLEKEDFEKLRELGKKNFRFLKVHTNAHLKNFPFKDVLLSEQQQQQQRNK